MKNLYLFVICILVSLASYSQQLAPRPDAPIAVVQFVSNEFQFQLSNPATSNNFLESYLYFDPNIDSLSGDQYWKFQGYLVYQVINDSISPFETTDTNYVRIAANVDISDTISALSYTSYDSVSGCSTHALTTTNLGIPSIINVSNDAFTGQPFIQEQSYCFRVYAYATNLYNIHLPCNTPDQILSSYMSGDGTSIVTHCVLASETLSIVDSEQISLMFYPNPLTDVLTIKNSSHESVEIIITDAEGRHLSEMIVIEIGTFDFSTYSPGYYLLHSKTETGNLIKTKKIIVTH